MTLAVVLVLAVLLFSAAFAGEITKAGKQSEKKSSQIGDAQTKPVAKKAKEPAEKVPAKPKASAVSPAQIAPAEMQPAEWQIEPLAASSDDEKGRVIKWQIICTGSGCGNDNVAFGARNQEFHYLCGTLGQVAVGGGSSPSFGVNQGFWQAPIVEEYLRGDTNGDGIVNVGDIVYLVSYLYKGGPEPYPVWVGDCNCDEIVNVGDIVFLVSYLYKGGDPPSC
jgi:hypothetical protein